MKGPQKDDFPVATIQRRQRCTKRPQNCSKNPRTQGKELRIALTERQKAQVRSGLQVSAKAAASHFTWWGIKERPKREKDLRGDLSQQTDEGKFLGKKRSRNQAGSARKREQDTGAGEECTKETTTFPR